MGSLFYNDDSIYAYKEIDCLSIIHTELERLGIPIHYKKAFCAKSCVFCEEYRGIEFDKFQSLHSAIAYCMLRAMCRARAVMSLGEVLESYAQIVDEDTLMEAGHSWLGFIIVRWGKSPF